MKFGPIKRTQARSVAYDEAECNDVLRAGTAFRLFRMDVFTSWEVGQAGDARTTVALHVREVLGAPGSENVSRFKQVLRPDQLTEVPDWLMYEILSCTPRDIG